MEKNFEEFDGICPQCKKGKLKPVVDTEGKSINISITKTFQCDNPDCGYILLPPID